MRAISEAVRGGYKEDVVGLLRKFDEDILDMDIAQDDRWEPQIILQHKRTGPTPLSVFGDGVRRAAVIAALIPRAKNGLLLIDEIETALHVSVVEQVFRLLGSAWDRFGVQVLATTHSLDAVDAAAKSFEGQPSALVGFRLQSTPEGIQAKRYPGELLQSLRFERGLDIR